MVVEELRNERVDVIQWDSDPSRFVANALSPAQVTRVLINDTSNYATVIVPDDQLSLAIGKEGQNARLAARLTGWHIDIKSASLASDLPEMITTLFDEEETADSDAGRCEYVSADGVRCRNHARPGSRFCGVHENAVLGETAGDIAGIADVANATKQVEHALASEDAFEADGDEATERQVFDAARDAVSLVEDELTVDEAAHLEDELGEVAAEVFTEKAASGIDVTNSEVAADKAAGR
jgi:hypothetical protein